MVTLVSNVMTVSFLTFVWIGRIWLPKVVFCVVKNIRHQAPIASLIISIAINNLLLWQSDVLTRINSKYCFSSSWGRERIARPTLQLVLHFTYKGMLSPVNILNLRNSLQVFFKFKFWSFKVKFMPSKFFLWNICKLIYPKSGIRLISVENRDSIQIFTKDLLSLQVFVFREVAFSVFENELSKLVV